MFKIQCAFYYQLVQPISIWTNHTTSTQKPHVVSGYHFGYFSLRGLNSGPLLAVSFTMEQETCEAKGSCLPRSPTCPSGSHTRYLRLSNSLAKGYTAHFQGLHESISRVYHKKRSFPLRVNCTAALCTLRLEEIQKDDCF